MRPVRQALTSASEGVAKMALDTCIAGGGSGNVPHREAACSSRYTRMHGSCERERRNQRLVSFVTALQEKTESGLVYFGKHRSV